MNYNLPERYAEVEELRGGGIAHAKRLHDSYLSRDVVFKHLSNLESIDRLQTEITSLQAAKSNHVVQIYDIIYSNSTAKTPCGLIEEYVSGKDLTSFVFDKNNSKAFIRLLYQISTGISDLHSCGIIHRDIKPSNIKFDKEGIVKIFDFNLAKTEPAPCSTITFAGTPGFMAPELYCPPCTINYSVDVYAFGILSFFLATCSLPPFSGTQHKMPRNPEPHERIEKLTNTSETISSMINKCVDTCPSNRPKISDIKSALHNELTKGTHKGLAISGKQIEKLSKDIPRVQIEDNFKNLIIIEYDGFGFFTKNVSGDVTINNVDAQPGTKLVKSCVITLGHKDLKYGRLFVTFDTNNEEFLL